MSCRCRWLWLFIASLLLCAQARAKCASRNLDIWPPSGPIPPNAVFVIEGYGLDRPLVENVWSCELILVSESENLCLALEDKHVGKYGVDQAVLRPEQPLTPGAAYRIRASDHDLHADQWVQSGLGSATWVADLPRDETSPTWAHQPRVTNVEVTEYGCGPAIGATVRIGVNDTGPILVHTVVGRGAGAPQSFLLKLVEGKIFIGHGMCGGGFDLIPGEKYQATLSPVDAAGNASETSPKQIEFTTPSRKRR